jgi:hypothetical protein
MTAAVDRALPLAGRRFDLSMPLLAVLGLFL